jgi:membrane associated rhomboid family serine protease
MGLLNMTKIVRTLLVLNIIIFITQEYFGYKNMIFSVLGLHYFTADNFNPLQLVTYLFVHGNFMHLFGNMLGLIFFGPRLESIWGEKRFLIFYLATGIGAGVIYMFTKTYDYSTLENATNLYLNNPKLDEFNNFLVHNYRHGLPEEALNLLPKDGTVTLNESLVVAQQGLYSMLNSPLIGASGAIFAILTAMGMLFPNTEMFIFPIPMPVKIKFLVTFYLFYEIYVGIYKMPGDNVAHFAHIGGMIFAFILIKMWGSKRDNFY